MESYKQIIKVINAVGDSFLSPFTVPIAGVIAVAATTSSTSSDSIATASASIATASASIATPSIALASASASTSASTSAPASASASVPPSSSGEVASRQWSRQCQPTTMVPIGRGRIPIKSVLVSNDLGEHLKSKSKKWKRPRKGSKGYKAQNGRGKGERVGKAVGKLVGKAVGRTAAQTEQIALKLWVYRPARGCHNVGDLYVIEIAIP